MTNRFYYERLSNSRENCATPLLNNSASASNLYDCAGPSSDGLTVLTTLDTNNNNLNNSAFLAAHRFLDNGPPKPGHYIRSSLVHYGYLPIILFFFIYFLLVCLGGICFSWLEVPKERSERLRLHAAQVAFLKTHQCVTSKELFDFLQHVLRATSMNIIATEIKNMSLYDNLEVPSDWSKNFDSPKLLDIQKHIGEIARPELDAEEHLTGNWNIDQAIFFGMTIVTTIGYGKVSPVTMGGKVFCIIFACFGIPVTLVFSSTFANICMVQLRRNREYLVHRFCKDSGERQKNSHQSSSLFRDRNIALSSEARSVCGSGEHRTTNHMVHFESQQIDRGDRQDKVMEHPRFSVNMGAGSSEAYLANKRSPIYKSEDASALDYIPPSELDETSSAPPLNQSEHRQRNESRLTFQSSTRSRSCPDLLTMDSYERIDRLNSPASPYSTTCKTSAQSIRPSPLFTKIPTHNFDVHVSSNYGYSNQSNARPSPPTIAAVFKDPSIPTHRHASSRPGTTPLMNYEPPYIDQLYSESEYSGRMQHSVLTLTSGASFARTSCLALVHFLLSRFDRALVVGVPVSSLRMGRRRRTMFRIRLLHCGIVTIVILLLIIFLPATAFHLIEPGWGYMDAFYFCVISMTTVGLGDLVPSSSDVNVTAPSPTRTVWRWCYSTFTAGYLLLGTAMTLVGARLFEDVLNPEFEHTFYHRPFSFKPTLESTASDISFEHYTPPLHWNSERNHQGHR